ncbi:MAG: aldehyde ferredoxin oxidoreductase family protein [Desulfobacterales bacterium]|nr:MAG: aldehyde ferredoxin oxidoreductase family protein [Desulfobacterales bacterium]
MALKRKLAYIDLDTETIKLEPIPIEWRRKFVGGRGLDAYLLYKNVSKGCDPLGPNNVAVISAGLLGGTLASASSRTHIAAKSPLTNLFGSANMGGFFAPEMRWAGIDHFVIRGKANRPVYIYAYDGEIEIRDADKVWGAGVYDTQDIIRKELGDDETQILCIGQAGENLVRYANVMTGRKNAGGRTGMGAVLGSKNLKAIACRGTMDIEISDPEEALEYNKQAIDQVISTKVSQIMQRWGTSFIYGVTNTTGLVRTRNFQYNQLPNSEDIEAENLDKYSIGLDGCFGCQIHCRHRYMIKKGEYAGTYAQGPEYTSQGAFGTEVGCRSMNTVLVGNHLVNDYGIDTLEIGSMIGWAMELYEKGVITDKDTSGLKLEWGNDEAVIEMIKQVAFRKGLGDILAEGPLPAAKKFGPDSMKYLIHVKGMSNLHSDERATPALALNVAVSSRGSDHLRGRPAIDLYNLPMKLLDEVYRNPDGYDGPLTNSYSEYEGKPRMVMWQELCYMAVDSLGVCKYHTVFLSPNHLAFKEFSKLIKLNTGLEFSEMDLWNCANRCYTIERLFNLREGMTREDDMLSDRYFDEPTKLGLPVARGKSIDRHKFKAMVDEYYQLHEWDEEGVPAPELLKRLDISDLWPSKEK